MLRRNADARVGDGDDRLAVLFADGHLHAAALNIIFDGVVAEVVDDLIQKPPYSVKTDHLSLDGDRDILLRRRGFEIVRRLLRQL